MKSRGIVLAAITAAFLVLAAWLAWRSGLAPVAGGGRDAAGTGAPVVTRTGEVIPSSVPTDTAAATPAAGGDGALVVRGLATPPVAVPVVTLPADGPAANSPAVRGRAEVEAGKVRRMITDYHTLMGENPVGTNAEIMRALMGANPHQATLGPPEGQTLNDKGELIDPWGTPYFFHQMSRDHMEIHSAGPDRVMGTADDVVVK